MDKKRQAIWDKSGGLCWYCGKDLPKKGWHADHFEPIRRDWWTNTCQHPEHENEENKVPACSSCNIMKGGLPLESFRKKIEQFVPSMNRYTNQYKFAKKYGLVIETDKPVVFWFEKEGKM